MERHEQEFNVIYCYQIEKNHSAFWRRINKIIIFSQIFLGTMVFSGIAGYQAYGAIIAALTIGAFVYHPERSAQHASLQMGKYSKLRLKMKSMSDSDFVEELSRIKESDSDVIGSLERASYNRATIEYGQPAYFKEMRWYERLAAFFAGDLPENPNHAEPSKAKRA